MNIAKDATQLVGNTPLVRINKISNDTNTEVPRKYNQVWEYQPSIEIKQ